MLPADYAAEHVALGYAVTVHKAEGITVDRAVLLADAATSAEHLYVGMTRGRRDNRVCVVTDAAGTGHGHQPPPGPIEVLAGVMRRSSAELSATETLRTELDRAEDRHTLRRLHEQARAYIDAAAGPDRRPELRRLQRLQGSLPIMRNNVAVNEREIIRLTDAIIRTRRSLSEAEAHLEDLSRRRWLRRPDQLAVDETHHRIGAQQRYLGQLEKERTRVAADLERSRRRLGDAERAVKCIPDVETAIARRRDWLRSHPAELAWEAELAARLDGTDKEPDRPPPDHEHTASDDGLEAALRSIDLRTIDLSPSRPRSGIERRLRETLGIGQPADPIDIPPPLCPDAASRDPIWAADTEAGRPRPTRRGAFRKQRQSRPPAKDPICFAAGVTFGEHQASRA